MFDPNKLLGEPVSIKISDVLVVLKLNENKKHKDQTYSDAYLQEYKKQVFSRTSTAESLKNSDVGNFALWLVDLANKKINLFISRVTVAFERNIKSKPPQPAHYFGASIEEIVIKSRTVIAQDR
ncbi:MAG: hypothetical protein JST59_00925 [Actinobacteria bacterium]|nr:hypothetical protein [Actinomycetota bacterium]